MSSGIGTSTALRIRNVRSQLRERSQTPSVEAPSRETVRLAASMRRSLNAESAVPLEVLLIHAVLLDDPPVHGLHGPVHGRVRLEDPAHLALRRADAAGQVEVLD